MLATLLVEGEVSQAQVLVAEDLPLHFATLKVKLVRNQVFLVVKLSDVLHHNQVDTWKMLHLKSVKAVDSCNECWGLDSLSELVDELQEDIELVSLNRLDNVLVVVSEEEQAATGSTCVA